MPIHGVSVKRVLKARRERVFAAWTRPELMARWLFPQAGWSVAVTSDPRVGGRYELVMRDAAGETHTQFGEYLVIAPVSRLVFTWSCPELGVEGSVVTVELLERDEHTDLTLTHELPADPKIRSGHEEGWKGCLENLANLLSQDS